MQGTRIRTIVRLERSLTFLRRTNTSNQGSYETWESNQTVIRSTLRTLPAFGHRLKSTMVFAGSWKTAALQRAPLKSAKWEKCHPGHFARTILKKTPTLSTSAKSWKTACLTVKWHVFWKIPHTVELQQEKTQRQSIPPCGSCKLWKDRLFLPNTRPCTPWEHRNGDEAAHV